MTAQANLIVRFERAIQARSVILAEGSARELGQLDLIQALALVRLCADTGDAKYERAAIKWLRLLLDNERPHPRRGPASRRVARATRRAVPRRRGYVPRQPRRPNVGPEDSLGGPRLGWLCSYDLRLKRRGQPASRASSRPKNALPKSKTLSARGPRASRVTPRLPTPARSQCRSVDPVADPLRHLVKVA